MNIKRVEIKGFKSFSDKTVLEFKPGICAIVGPNGCGKSNIFEAIRWVMGEQRVRNLRSKKMEEVIFNGSDTRKPVGMAEVRLILSNTGSMVPPSMADYDEIMITRRLLRDGDAQYEINNIPCRLSDVTDFFLDTGVGKNSYAIIEQGRVDMVVNSRPEDRRVLIEEAAGINRYKVRREAALKKLERTRQNLLRISDVISEVKRQNASLKRQAQRAERYHKLSEHLRELDVGLHAYRCFHLQQQYRHVKEDLDKDRARLLEKETQCTSLQAQLEKERLKALQTEKALKEILEVRHKTDLELASVRNHIERHRAAIARFDEFARRSGADRESLEQKREQSVGLLQELVQNKSVVHMEMETARNELGELLQVVRSVEQGLAHEKETEDRLKEDLFRTLQETAQERNRRDNLKRRQAEIVGELSRIEQETAQADLSLETERTRCRQLAQQAEEIAVRLHQETEKKEALRKDRLDTHQTADSLQEEIAEKEKELAATRARRESLEEMLSNYAVYGEGVRFLMQDGDYREDAELLGPLAEMIEVPAEFQKALAAALGDRLGHLVVSSPQAGVQAAERLHEAGAGRSTFIPRSPRSEDPAGPVGVPEGLTRLKDVVKFSDGLDGLGDFLLGRCYVVDDLRQAFEIWESNGIHVDLVTAQGEVLSRHGEITGGSGDNLREEVFQKKREIAHLNDVSGAVEGRIRELRSSLVEHQTRLEHISAQIDLSERALNELAVQEAGLRKDLQGLQASMETSTRNREVLILEKERLEKERGTIGSEIEQSEQGIARLESVRQELDRAKEQAHEKAEQLTLSLQEKSDSTGLLRVRLAQLEERHLSIEKELGSAENVVAELERQLEAIVEETRRKTEEHQRNQHDLSVALTHEEALMQRHGNQAAQIEMLNRDSVASAAALKSIEEEVTAEEKAQRDLTHSVHALEMEAVRLEQSTDGLVEKIRERYQVDPREVTPPDAAPDENEISQLRQKMEALGEVNLAAIAESRYIEERLNFLLEQEADLNKAVNSLYLTINKINKTTRERFQEAFDSINSKFQEIFPVLFRGGEARLELTDEDDLLETGVDIMARPPGKRVRNMDLLSGGEKALTAVGLIFSIFLTRPSPFCLLDEVDAPLDDSNIARFNEMLRQLSEQTQFLVITHNKRSMEAADTLYGVTMEEAGCSAVVSVELKG